LLRLKAIIAYKNPEVEFPFLKTMAPLELNLKGFHSQSKETGGRSDQNELIKE
jgi:hypothetical protein